jgi:hypothetical protein
VDSSTKVPDADGTQVLVTARNRNNNSAGGGDKESQIQDLSQTCVGLKAQRQLRDVDNLPSWLQNDETMMLVREVLDETRRGEDGCLIAGDGCEEWESWYNRSRDGRLEVGWSGRREKVEGKLSRGQSRVFVPCSQSVTQTVLAHSLWDVTASPCLRGATRRSLRVFG